MSMGGPARAISSEEALEEILLLQSDGVILLEGTPSPRQVSLDGWNPYNGVAEDGNVAGVVIRYLGSGSLRSGQPSHGTAPDRLDSRNAVALVRLCQWLSDYYGVYELYHLGISGDATGARQDCHGQGRAVDFVGVRGLIDDIDWALTVNDDWGTVSTAVTPDGNWPSGTGSNVSYRLDDPSVEPFVSGFFRDVYRFIASEWQDRSAGPDPAGNATSIGEGSFVMHPDHPTSSPGTPHGREAHKNHIHMQIGVTGTET
jgi:hypothetical protein